MKNTQCRNFDHCNAAVCPLDPSWRKAVHLPGEPMCRYLLASGKAGAAEHYRGEPEFAACCQVCPAACRKHPDIAKRVARAAPTGFRGDNLRTPRQTPSHDEIRGYDTGVAALRRPGSQPRTRGESRGRC